MILIVFRHSGGFESISSFYRVGRKEVLFIYGLMIHMFSLLYCSTLILVLYLFQWHLRDHGCVDVCDVGTINELGLIGSLRVSWRT